MAKKARCPVCKDSIELESGLGLGDVFDCPGCVSELKVIQLDPVELEEEVSSWNDYEGEDEEEEDFNGKRKKEKWS